MSIFSWVNRAITNVGKGVTTAANAVANAVASAAVWTGKTADGVGQGLIKKNGEEIERELPFLKEEKKD